jgi:tetratricopeptide (TPR) repeat protein
MEVAIILIVVGILGYVFYQTLPNPKFQKAKSLFDSGNLDEAVKILETIFEKHPEAALKLAECKLKLGQKAKVSNEALKYFNDVVEIKKGLPNNAVKKKYELVEAKAKFEIALFQFKSATSVASAESKIKNLKDNLQFIDSATQSGSESNFSELKNKHCSELARLYFASGLQCEKESHYSDAIRKYKTAKDYSTKGSLEEIRNNSAARIGICKLKENPRDIEFVSFEEYNKADQKYAHDFFYRYVIYLLKKESYSDAETILKTHLNLPSRTVEQLKELLKTKQIRHAVRKVEEINTTIEKLYEKSFPVDEVKTFYENLDVRINEIKPVIPEIADKLQAIKPSLFNRLLSHYISVEQFGNGIKLIQNFPKFWDSPELLKNLGICCYGYTAKGNISDKNFRIVISNWLTSVFSDRVILNSLEATSWDDNYTFTLIDSIGSNYQQHCYLPDNANYDDITDTNISIGATQRELLQQFETVLHKTISEPSLSKSVHDCYTEEKDGVERIVSVITNDILFAAPHFAKSYGLNEEIIKELDNDYAKYSNEESLEAGIPYLKSNSNTYVREYATARETVSTMVTAIQSENLNDLKYVATEKKRAIIEKYETINDSMEDTLFHAFTSKIEEDGDNEDLIPLMEECIRFAKENSKLRTQCSTYIHDYCDSNWRTKPAVRLLELMIKSIRQNPNNYRAAKSLTILINNNLMDITNDATNSTSKIYSLIDEVKNIRSQVLKDALKELITLRNKVLDSLGAETVRTIALDYNLNSNGMKLKKVLDTMQTLGGGSSMTNSL